MAVSERQTVKLILRPHYGERVSQDLFGPGLIRLPNVPQADFLVVGRDGARPIAYGFTIVAVVVMVNRLGYENDIVCFDPSIDISSPTSKLNTSSTAFPTH